jgi:putative transposase
LQQKLKDLDRAVKDAFDKNQPDKRFPVFKKKFLHDSFRYPQGFKLEGNRIFLPKVGWVRFFKSREIEGRPKNVTVSRQGKHWFVSIQTERVIADPVHPSGSMVGIDLGVKRFAALSNGEFVDPVNSFKRWQDTLAREQRKLSRKVKFSANWRKQKARITALHTKIANARNDFLHKTSTTISKNHAIVVMEDLRIKNMSASARGSVEDPGKNVRQKAGLNRSILDQGWGNFRRMLEYKQAWSGGEVVLVQAMYTSQRCPECGHVDKANRKSQAVFKCMACGYEKNADLSAATNILAAGHAVLACGGTGVGHPMKQEPLAA